MTDDARYAALAARDRRFDGVFFVGVTTTGIYCRPICPVRVPARARCEFYASAALAERAGFRACFRCRPEVAPGAPPGYLIAPRFGGAAGRQRVPPVDAVDALAAAATRRIAEGALNDRSIDELAAELGVTARHVRRATETRLGVSPVELAQSARLALAKQLLHDTALPITEIAFASGFSSVRRFNAVFAQRIGKSPSRARPIAEVRDRVALRLDYRPPYDWTRLLGFLRGRAIPGVEVVGDDVYRRIVHIAGHTGELEVRPAPNRSALLLAVTPELMPVLMPLRARVRRMFDLDARPDAIARVLRRDRTIGKAVAARPGLRLPGAIDPFEAAVRAMLGQQVSVAAARTLAGRFAAAFGRRYAGSEPALSSRFPTAVEVHAVGWERIVKIGMPVNRAVALHGLAGAVANGQLRLDGARPLDEFVAEATRLAGVGPWTAHYLAMRALHDPDAFPAADLGIKKALRGAGPRAAEARAEAWRPFRSYAVIHLWTALSEGD